MLSASRTTGAISLMLVAMNPQRLTLRVLAITAAAGLALAGCGTADDEPADTDTNTVAPDAGDDPEETTDESTDDATDEPTDEATDDATDDSTDGSAGDGEHAVPLAAIALAQDETGGTAFELDEGDGGVWEVTVAIDDRELEVWVGSDGTEVTSTHDEGSLESEDRDGLAAATITISDAIEIAAGEHSGQLDDVNLDSDGGTFAWEVAFMDDTEVYIDVTNGDVLRVETD